MYHLKSEISAKVKSFKDTRYLFNLFVVISIVANSLFITWPAQATGNPSNMPSNGDTGETNPAIDMPLQRRHPYAGIYSVWDGEVRSENLGNYPYLKGVHLYAKWSDLKPTENGSYQWDVLDQRVQQKTGNQKNVMLFLQVNAHWPDWVFDYVAKGEFSKRDQRIPQFWDPTYIKLYKQFIYDLAQYIGRASYKDRVVLVRAQFNAFTPESLRPDGHLSYQDYSPTPSGHRYAIDYTDAIGDDYARQITRAYVEAFKPLGIYVVQKSFSNSGHDQSIAAEYVEMGSGLFATNNGPNPDSRQAIYEFSTSLVARSFSEPGTLGHCASQPAEDALRFIYWSGLSALHQGVEFISFYGCDVLDTKYGDIFKFVNKYAGWYREPGNSPGAWIAFRDIKNSTERDWMSYLEGNYEYLVEQIDPDTSTGLFAYPGAGNLDKSTWKDINELNPLSKPVTDLGPKTQKEGVWARKTNGQPLYLDLNNTFASSLSGEITFRISYFDKGNGKFKLVIKDRAGTQQTYSFTKKNTGLWQEATLTLDSYQFANNLSRGADILLDNGGDDDDIFHMVEITKGGGGIKPTPTVQPTQTPLPTVLPTSTPLPVPTATPTTPPDNSPPIFMEGFESGNLSSWSDLSGRQDLKIDSAAAMFGKAGLNVALIDPESRWVENNDLPDLSKVHVRFYFDPNTVKINAGDNFMVARLAGADKGARVQLSFKNNQYWIRLGVFQRDNNWKDTEWLPFTDMAHAIEFNFVASSSRRATDGLSKLWVDGTQVAKLTDLNTQVDTVNQLTLGALRGLDPGTRGNIYFDQVEVATRYIGLELTTPPTNLTLTNTALPDESTAPMMAVDSLTPVETPASDQMPLAGPVNPDRNGDGIVNILDLAVVASGYGSSETQADVNGNATVDIFDLVLVAEQFGQTPEPPVQAVETPLPQPSSTPSVEPVPTETVLPQPTDPAVEPVVPTETTLPVLPTETPTMIPLPTETPLPALPTETPTMVPLPTETPTTVLTSTVTIPPTEQPAP